MQDYDNEVDMILMIYFCSRISHSKIVKFKNKLFNVSFILVTDSGACRDRVK